MSGNLQRAQEALKARAAAPPTTMPTPQPLNITRPVIVTPAIPIPPLTAVPQVNPQQQFIDIRKILEDVGMEFRAERMRRALTQRQLATISGASQGSITRLENGSDVSIWMMARVAKALQMKIKLTK